MSAVFSPVSAAPLICTALLVSFAAAQNRLAPAYGVHDFFAARPSAAKLLSSVFSPMTWSLS
jgi:hypothetical protein